MPRIVIQKTFIGKDISKLDEEVNNFKRQKGCIATTPDTYIVDKGDSVVVYHKVTVHYQE